MQDIFVFLENTRDFFWDLVTKRQFDFGDRSCFWDLLDWTRAVFSLKLSIPYHCGEPSWDLNSMPMNSVYLMGIVTTLSPVWAPITICFMFLGSHFPSLESLLHWHALITGLLKIRERHCASPEFSSVQSSSAWYLFCEISLPWFAPDSQLQLSGSASTWVSSACTHSPEISPKAVSWENHRVNPIHFWVSGSTVLHCLMPSVLKSIVLYVLLDFAFVLFCFQEGRSFQPVTQSWPNQSHCIVTLDLYVHHPAGLWAP